MTTFVIILCFLCCIYFASISCKETKPEPWNLPLLPSVFPEQIYTNNNGKLIPRHLWMAFKAIPELRQQPDYLTKMLSRNSGWNVTFADNEYIDAFMDKYYAGTSVHWAYKSVNPKLGVMYADIWRYSALYLFGGLYLDDDSYIESPYDNVSVGMSS